MSAGIILMVARDPFHTLAYKDYKYRIWATDQPEPEKSACMDIVQVIVLDRVLEPQADSYFIGANKYYDGDKVIYAHPSLENGMFTSGYVLVGHEKLYKFLKEIDVKFMTGLYLDREERNEYAKSKSREMKEPLLHEKLDVHWHTVHPSNCFTNCFDGYGMVDIHNLYSLQIELNGMSWLNLNRQHFQWLEMTGMRYFPMIIHPFRIDQWIISARWEQPTDYVEIYRLCLWNDPPDRMCGCGRMNKPPSSALHMELIAEVIVRKEMKYLYYNQNRQAIKAAYTNGNGVGRFHGYLSSEFRIRVTKIMIMNSIHIS